MGVFKRGNTYWISYSYQGKQHRESANTANKKEAEALFAKRQTELFEGTNFPTKQKTNFTLQQLVDYWLNIKSRKASISDDLQRLSWIIKELKPNTLINSITTQHILALQRKLEKTRKPATVNRYLDTLHAALNLIERQGYQTLQPFKTVTRLQVVDNRDRIASPQEYQTLIKSARYELRLAIVIGYYTGMRLNEIACLLWEWVDLQNGIIHLPASVTKTKEGRKVPLHKEVVKALESHKAKTRAPRVFDANSYRLCKRFIRLKKKLGYEDLRFHDLRHTALTRLRKAGNDVLVLKAISGHKTMKMLERYVKIDTDDLKAAMDKVGI